MIANTAAMQNDEKPLLLEMYSLTKHFPGILGFFDADFKVSHREAVTLIGNNKAGKLP